MGKVFTSKDTSIEHLCNKLALNDAFHYDMHKRFCRDV